MSLEIVVAELLAELAIPPAVVPQYLTEVAWQLKGWIGYLKWQQQYANNPYVIQSVLPLEPIAIWLAYEVFWLNNQKVLKNIKPEYGYVNHAAKNDITHKIWLAYIEQVSKDLSVETCQLMNGLMPSAFTAYDLCWLWQRAYEISYQAPLHQALVSQKDLHRQQLTKPNQVQGSSDDDQPTKAQWVFCIDVRSEGFRRYLEQVGPHETFGFAGFFGIAYQLDDRNSKKKTCQCPALLEPSLLVEMLEAPESLSKQAVMSLSKAVDLNRKTMLAPFALYEMLGIWFSLALVVKNYVSTFVSQSRQKHLAQDKHVVGQSIGDHFVLDHISVDTLFKHAKGLLKGMGLTENFAQFVVICGHSAKTENNPYQAALDCGACGGNSGMSNAVIACQMLNNPAVRAMLASDNIIIPQTTLFIPACHNTTTDKIDWYVEHEKLSHQQLEYFKDIKQDAVDAGIRLQQERLSDLPGDKNPINRSMHWAELIPEWGLANNAAFIIGQRQLTKSLNLDRRVFLHSYICAHDPDGSILESILLGPVVVAHWINSQYYFSSVSPTHYGAGNKIIHNILPNVGVIEGNQSDLKYGLPYQSVFYRNQRMHHPQRLFVLIDAKADKVDAIIRKHPTLQSLVEGRWLFIKAIADGNDGGNFKHGARGRSRTGTDYSSEGF